MTVFSGRTDAPEVTHALLQLSRCISVKQFPYKHVGIEVLDNKDASSYAANQGMIGLQQLTVGQLTKVSCNNTWDRRCVLIKCVFLTQPKAYF